MNSREEDIAWLRSTFHPIPRPALPDDCIEYSLYIIESTLDTSNSSEIKNFLRTVQKDANQLQKQWLKDYIWQRQPFNLELDKTNGEVAVDFLRGRTEYGDSIEDEWVIVWLLRELTKKYSNLWIKLTDSDGEFLLIEASGTLPAWLEPEVAENRVWINNGQLKIIKPSGASRSSKRTEEKLSLEDAHRIIISESKRIMHSVSMEEEAFYRLRNYPGQISENMHHAMVSIPRKVAFLLLQKPSYVAPAIEAFYLRDPIALKPLRGKSENLLFPPNDLVEISTTFPRVAYAQLKSQNFPILDIWKTKMPSPSEIESRTRTELGMKLTSGFEMLLTDKHWQDRADVREMHLLLEDIEPSDASLPSDDMLSKLEKRMDDESWLDIDFEDLQQEMNGKKRDESGRKPEFGDKAAQENLQRIVKQFESFMNDDKLGDDSGLFNEGDSDTDDLDDIDSDDLEEDRDASFDEDEFTKIMQEMMGMPPEVMNEIRSGNIDALQNGAAPPDSLISMTGSVNKEVDKPAKSDDEDEEITEIRDLTKRMGTELRSFGALDLNAESSTSRALSMPHDSQIVEDLSSDDEDVLDEKNEQIAKSLLESLQAQGGASGPAGSLMALMAQQYALEDEEKSKKRKAKK